MVSSVGLGGCNHTITNLGFLSSCFKAESCCWTSIVHNKMHSAFYPILGTSCIKPNFYKHPSPTLAELHALCCVCISTVLLHVVSAPVGAIVTGISRHLFPLISGLFKKVNDEGLETNMEQTQEKCCTEQHPSYSIQLWNCLDRRALCGCEIVSIRW